MAKGSRFPAKRDPALRDKVQGSIFWLLILGSWILSLVFLPSPSLAIYNPLCGTDNLGANTAIGCLMAGKPTEFIGQLLGWGVGVGGGIAFLLIVYAGFMIATAAGDPKRVQAGRELLMSAIGGLILIVLSVLLLNFIGVNILGLSDLGFKISP